MANQNMMQMVLAGILLLCGYIYLLQIVLKRSANKNAAPFIAVFLLAIYGVAAAVLLFALSAMGSSEMTVMGLLLLIAAGVLTAAVFGAIRSFRQLKKGMLAMFLIYLLGVAYITIFSRDVKTGDTLIQMAPFAAFTQKRANSAEMINHMLLNVGMFVPLGLLFPLIYPEKLSHWGYILGIGLTGTVLIETTQLLLRLGVCDIDDIIANTLGAVVGYVIYLIYRRFTGREEYEDA